MKRNGNERLKEQWRRDKESDERNERNRKEMNIQVYKDIEYFNKREEEDRKKKLTKRKKTKRKRKKRKRKKRKRKKKLLIQKRKKISQQKK